MALGKARTNKRSSSASYTSTVTTVVIIALCVLGVWMLTSDNIITPQSTNRASITSSADQKFTNPVRKPNGKENQGAFEDNPGDLPEDALKSDEPQRSQSQEDSGGATVEGTTNQAEEGSEKQEGGGVEDENQGKESGTGEDAGQGNVEEKETPGEQEKQDAQETQVSEESTVTQNQNLEQQSYTENSAERESLKDSENEGSENNTNQNNNEQQDQAEESTTKEEEQSRTEDEGSNEDSTKQFPDENQKGKQQEDEGQSNEKQGEDSNENEKPVMFSDETKQETSAKPVDEEVITKDNDQQSKPATQEQNSGGSEEQEESKQDSQNEGGGSMQENNYQDSTTESTQEKQGETNSLPNSGIPKESKESRKSWSTQAAESDKEKERRKDKPSEKEDGSIYGYTWHLCNETAGPDYIPCLDNAKALKQLHSTKHFEHRERHCPEDPPTCLVPLPEGYKTPIPWPTSRDKIWFHNVPHTTLAEVKGHQNWVKVTGEFLTFPGGGTQFIHGALHYIDFIQQSVPGIAWGKRTRVVLDVGCGVASFGGYLFDRDVLTMSFAPKDEHEAQVQFALERGIPAISAVMGSQRLPFPSGVFDLVHCARCRVPWHAEGGRLLLELNRVLRPGGHFVWSATPVYQKLQEDVEIWEAMSSLTASMCWKLETIQKDAINKIGAAIYRKPSNNQCYKQRKQNSPPMCKDDDDPNAAWYVPLQPCMHRVPEDPTQRGSKWPIRWAKRMRMPPYWLNQSQMGIYGKPAPDDFTTDYEHWKQVVNNSYLKGLGISWKNVRNVMDMRAVYGGFAAALRDLQVWVLNVVNVNAPDTLPIIYERGLFGIYHDWCEGFSMYPRTYDLLHADHLFSRLKERCKLAPVMAEIDRIVRPGGKLIVRDESSAISEVENSLKSLHWEVHLTFSKDQEGILSAQKSSWRPNTYAAS